MAILSFIMLFLLTLFGYSIGVAQGAPDKRVNPRLADMVVMALLWIAAFASRESLGKWLGEMRSEIETIHHELEWVTSQLRDSPQPTEHVWPRPQDEKTAKLGSEYWLG